MTKEPGAAATFLDALEAGVRAVLADKKASASERIAAITAGVKVAMIKHRISDSESESFFK